MAPAKSRAARRRARSRRARRGFASRGIAVGLVLAAIAAAVFGRHELAALLRLIGRVSPWYVLLALALQALTYLCAGLVWRLALARGGRRVPLRELVRLALAMLFSNQAVPSAGVSGGLVVMRALVGRGVSRRLALGALLIGLVTTYFAFVAALGVTLVLLARAKALTSLATGVAAVFVLAAALIGAAVLDVGRLRRRIPVRVAQMRAIGPAVRTLMAVPPSVVRAPALLAATTAVQIAELCCDAATYYVSLLAVGRVEAPGRTFACYVIASASSRIALVPLGLGTFEATSVVMLHGAGVPVRTALAATLLYRGLELWLPMAPGVWFARRAFTQPSGRHAPIGVQRTDS